MVAVRMALLIVIGASARVAGRLDPKPRAALMSIWKALGGEDGSWIRSDNWGTGDPCEPPWFGVTCKEGSIISLVLVRNGLVGSLPDEIGDLGEDLQVRHPTHVSSAANCYESLAASVHPGRYLLHSGFRSQRTGPGGL